MGKQECCTTWCCPGRLGWFTSLFNGLLFSFAVFALAGSIVAWSSASFAFSQVVYTQTGLVMRTGPANHVLAGSTIIQLALPNNLVEYVGASYVIDCATAPAHTVRIMPGSLVTTWDGTNTVAHCVQGGGFRFRVISSSFVRLESVTGGVTFSP